MLERIEMWRREGRIGDLDAHFARFIARLDGDPPPGLVLAACLASNAVGGGHVCADLGRFAGRMLFGDSAAGGVRAPPCDQWLAALRESPVVGGPGQWRPLVLESGRLYLHRYWRYEQSLAQMLRSRARERDEAVDRERLREGLRRLFPEDHALAIDWQKVAAAVAATRRLCVISGGPGTGKTTTVTRLLALLVEQRPGDPPRIRLAAPTGKAAARLSDSIRQSRARLDCAPEVQDAIPEVAGTLHRLLGARPGRVDFRHDADHPLAVDVLVVDEASMVDLSLMVHLLRALPPRAHLILLGDRDQLASVEAGSVLGEICRGAGPRLWSTGQREEIGYLAGCRLPEGSAENGPLFADGLVLLEHSYRFGADSGIGQLADAVRAGDVDRTAAVLQATLPDLSWHEQGSGEMLTRLVISAFGPLLTLSDPREALGHLWRFRILCALRTGPRGVEGLNQAVEGVLRRADLLHGRDPWYAGRPVMITRNDYALGLFNGDTGICLPDPAGDHTPRVWFPDDAGGMRPVAPARLPPHETAWAMTVHKSQGSEFERILLVLPREDSRVLTRELVYTAITRARRHVEIWGRSGLLREAIRHRVERDSGLHERLWGGG